jgi:hypothetical protein
MERPKQMIGLGGGFFGGMSGAMSEMDLLMSEDLYLRVGIAVTDSLNLSPNKDWRRFAPLCFDAVYYFDRNYYFGGGLNYPLKISDDERPSVGGEAFIGLEFPVYDRHRIYGELGYSVAARAVGESFGGLHFLFGWRYEIIPAQKIAKAAEPIITMQTTPESISVVPAASYPTPDAESADKAEITRLEQELIKVGDYIQELDTKIIMARKQKDPSRVASLKALKEQSIARANALRDVITAKKSK